MSCMAHPPLEPPDDLAVGVASCARPELYPLRAITLLAAMLEPLRGDAKQRGHLLSAKQRVVVEGDGERNRRSGQHLVNAAVEMVAAGGFGHGSSLARCTRGTRQHPRIAEDLQPLRRAGYAFPSKEEPA